MDAKKDLMWVLFFLFIIGVVWFFTGGPNRPSAKSGWFLFKPQETQLKQWEEQKEKVAPIDGKKTATSTTNASTTPTEITYKGKVTINAGWNAEEANPQKEYIEINVNSDAKNPINISKWKLKGKLGLDIIIGDGTLLPLPPYPPTKQNIVLNPGDRAYIVTGKSPLDASFKINKCLGYITQTQTFYPSIYKECPYAKDENLPNNLKDACLDYIDDISRCETPTTFPFVISNDMTCREYLTTKVNYKGCIDAHRADKDFYKNEWRIYLGRNEEMWKQSRETTTLYDENGKVVDEASY